jgi:hypothetical protein
MSEPYWVPLAAQPVDYEGAWAAGTQYVPGDVVRYGGIDYLCVNPALGQTPPLAVAAAAGRELAYAEFLANVSVSVTTEATAVTVVTAPATVFDGSPVLIEFSAPGANPHNATLASLTLTLWEDGVCRGTIAIVQTPATSYLVAPVRCARRLTPAAGSHTFAIRAHTSAGVAGVQAGPGGPGQQLPGFIRITKVVT